MMHFRSPLLTHKQTQSHPHSHRQIEAAEAKLYQPKTESYEHRETNIDESSSNRNDSHTIRNTESSGDQIERDQIKHQPNCDQEQSQFG